MIKCRTGQIPLENCDNFRKRLIGNCFKRKINKVLCFPKCNAIHTFFMFSSIDVIMLNKDMKVKFVYNNLKPWRIIFPKKNIYYTLEFPKGENIYKVNDIIKI